MISLKTLQTKNFMNTLLRGDAFQSFLLEEATVQTYNTFTIDGHVNREFYGDTAVDEAPYVLSPWSSMQNICFELIKGKHTPLSFRFILHLKPEQTDSLLQKGESGLTSSQVAFVLNIRFLDGSITLTTATAISTFVLDKSYEKIWDDAMRKFLAGHSIDFEEL